MFSSITFMTDLTHIVDSVICYDQDGTERRNPYPPPLSLLPKLKRLTVWDSIHSREGFEPQVLVFSPIHLIAHFVATSLSLERLILHVGMAPWHINDIAKSDIWGPLVSLAERPSLEHIELGVVPVVSKKRR